MKKRLWILWLVLMGLIILSCCIGRYELSVSEIGKILLGKSSNEMDRVLFYQVRLSRTFFCVLAGGALSLAGMVYQSIFRNPLVSPDVLGVSSGCSIGAILVILSSEVSGVFYQGLPFLFGIGTVFITITLARAFHGDKKYMMVLAGIIVGSLANSVIMVLKYAADPNKQLPAIEYWLMGTFQNAGWEGIFSITPVILAASILLYLLRWKMNVIALEEEEARSLGVNVTSTRLIAIFAATVLVAAVVSKVGVVSWIGLIAPHIARRISGEQFSTSYGSSILTGSILLLLSDILARTVFTAEIPISIMTSFLGAILLGVLLIVTRIIRR